MKYFAFLILLLSCVTARIIPASEKMPTEYCGDVNLYLIHYRIFEGCSYGYKYYKIRPTETCLRELKRITKNKFRNLRDYREMQRIYRCLQYPLLHMKFLREID